MIHAISFGATWTGWFRGWHHSFERGLVGKLRSAPDEFFFHFGMNASELVEQIPIQVTWANQDPDRWIFEEEVVTPDHLEPEVLHQWMTFNHYLLLPAVKDRRIKFDLRTNYYDFAQTLAATGEQVANYLNSSR